MRVTTVCFAIESHKIANSIPPMNAGLSGCARPQYPTTVQEVIHAYREWLGMREGESRTASFEKSIQRGRPAHNMKVSLSIVVAEQTTNGLHARTENEP